VGKAGTDADPAAGWRGRLCARLKASVGQTLILGDLFDEAEDLIPEYSANRTWNTQGYHSESFVTMRQMRWRTFMCELRHYPIERPGVASRTPWRHTTSFQVQVRKCAYCETDFVNRRDTITCSPEHGAQMKGLKKRAALLRQDELSVKRMPLIESKLLNGAPQFVLYGRKQSRTKLTPRRTIYTSDPAAVIRGQSLNAEAILPVPRVVVHRGKYGA
jgi:hypothetical protein